MKNRPSTTKKELFSKNLLDIYELYVYNLIHSKHMGIICVYIKQEDIVRKKA